MRWPLVWRSTYDKDCDTLTKSRDSWRALAQARASEIGRLHRHIEDIQADARRDYEALSTENDTLCSRVKFADAVCADFHRIAQAAEVKLAAARQALQRLRKPTKKAARRRKRVAA